MPVGLGKPCPTGRERIERRREQIGRAVAPRVERALVVGLDEDDVRWFPSTPLWPGTELASMLEAE